MTAQTWPWAGSHPSSGWPWLLNVSTSATLAKGEDYQGKYPQPIKLGPKTTCWRESDILALIGKH